MVLGYMVKGNTEMCVCAVY